eukprot:g370.t1
MAHRGEQNPFSKNHYTTVRDKVSADGGRNASARTPVHTDRGSWSVSQGGGDHAIERTTLRAEGTAYSPFIDWEWVGCKSEKDFHRIQHDATSRSGLRQTVKEGFARLERLERAVQELEKAHEAGDGAAGGGDAGGTGDGAASPAPGADGAAAASSGGGGSGNSAAVMHAARDLNRQLHMVADLLQVKKQGVLRGRFDAMFHRIEELRQAVGDEEVRARAVTGASLPGESELGSEDEFDEADSLADVDGVRDTDLDDDESITDSISTLGGPGHTVGGQMLGVE